MIVRACMSLCLSVFVSVAVSESVSVCLCVFVCVCVWFSLRRGRLTLAGRAPCCIGTGSRQSTIRGPFLVFCFKTVKVACMIF